MLDNWRRDFAMELALERAEAARAAQATAQAEKYLRLFDLWERRSEKVGGYSKGMRQKLAIVRAPGARLDPGPYLVAASIVQVLWPLFA